MRKMYNSLVSMFVKGWGKLFGEDRNIPEYIPKNEDPYTCELKEGDKVELLPQQDHKYGYLRTGGVYEIGVCWLSGNLGVLDGDGHVLPSSAILLGAVGRSAGHSPQFNRSHWKKVG